MRWAIVGLLLLVSSTTYSEESGSRDKAEAAQNSNQRSEASQPAPPPAPTSAFAPIINIYTKKHPDEPSHCASPKDWKEWGSFAWCRTLDWIDAERIIAIFTVILGIATGILGVATVRLARSTDRLVEGADRTAERQLRAYISAESGGHLRQSQKHRLRFEFRPIIINNGLTPALNVTILSRCYLCEYNVPDGFDFEFPSEEFGQDPNRSVTTIAPRQSKVHNAVVVRPFLTKQELRDIWMVRKRFHLYGTIRYTDVFGEPRRTNSSFLISVGNKRANTLWHNTERHNDQT